MIAPYPANSFFGNGQISLLVRHPGNMSCSLSLKLSIWNSGIIRLLIVLKKENPSGASYNPASLDTHAPIIAPVVYFLYSLSLESIIGACALACREALHCAERQMVFVLENDEVIRKRRGYPDVMIHYSEIDTLSEELGRLIVRRSNRRGKLPFQELLAGMERSSLSWQSIILFLLVQSSPCKVPPC